MTIDAGRRIADAVLYEGYVLYPYRASAQKNRLRWQFGVLAPRGYGEAASEPWRNQTECLVEPGDEAVLEVHVRFLQVQARTVEEHVAPDSYRAVESIELDDSVVVGWEEGIEREISAAVSVSDALSEEQVVPFEVPGGTDVEPVTAASGQRRGRIVRRREPVTGRLRVSAAAGASPFGALKVRLVVENATAWGEAEASRDEALLRSLVAVHSLVCIADGSFISLLEPPEWARADVDACDNLHTWPVLVGEEGARDVMLSSPIILYDYPQIAPESAGELFDGTEIDEILSLRTMALTEEEKREARATDARAADVIDRVDSMPSEMMDRLHGAIRYLREVSGDGRPSTTRAGDAESTSVPWWDPGMDDSVSPSSDTVWVGGAALCRDSRVVLSPGKRRADAQDVFLEGRTARVEAVLRDVDDETYLAVTLEDDPAADLQQAHGRFLYFRPDEVVPAEQGS